MGNLLAPDLTWGAARASINAVVPGKPATILQDDFTDGIARQFANGGRMPAIGGTAWNVTGGSQVYAMVGGAAGFTGQAGHTGKIYAIAQLTEIPSEIGGVFQWTGVVDGILEPPTIACIKTGDEATFANMWHCLFFANGNSISDCYFGQTYWLDGAASQAPAAAINSYGVFGTTATKIALAVGVDYVRRVRFQGSWCVATIEAMDGTVLAHSEVYDSHLPSVIGSSVFFETSNSSLRWKNVWAYGGYNAETAVARKMPTGLDDTPIGLKVPRPVVGSLGAFGAGVPSSGAPLTVGLRGGEHADVIGYGALSELRVVPAQAGYGSRLSLGGWGSSLNLFTVDYGAAYDVTITNHGVVAMGQTYADKHWYVQAGLRLGGASGKLLASGTAAPTAGTYAVGDRVFNSAPASGSPKSWVCTVAGSPGTWVSEGNL